MQLTPGQSAFNPKHSQARQSIQQKLTEHPIQSQLSNISSRKLQNDALAGLQHHSGRHSKNQKTLTFRAGKSPTLSRAVDSHVQLAIRSSGKQDRFELKRQSQRDADMDLTDLISRLEVSMQK